MRDSQRREWCLGILLRSSLILFLSTTSALAQLSTAALNGVVTDASGAVVRSANVVLRNVDTGIENQATTKQSDKVSPSHVLSTRG